MSFFHDAAGKPSMMRLLAFLAAIAGMVLIGSGIVGFFMRYSNSISVILQGAGLFSIGEILKTVQKGYEKK